MDSGSEVLAEKQLAILPGDSGFICLFQIPDQLFRLFLPYLFRKTCDLLKSFVGKHLKRRQQDIVLG